MNDSDRAILAELNADAAADEAAWSIRCPQCGALILGDYSDLDGHLAMECEAEESEAA